jgi:hypothetical protein
MLFYLRNRSSLFHGALRVGQTCSSDTVVYNTVFAGSDEVTVELVVLRGIAQSSEHSGALYDWASEVVARACHDRRNVRVCSAHVYFCFTSLFW